jgi:excisionase family DNA binding protein
MEIKLLTIRDVAEFMRLSEQTIQRYVMNREIPFHKVKKVIRFRLSEIETWIDGGGGKSPEHPVHGREGDLFAGTEDRPANSGKGEVAGEPAGTAVEGEGNTGGTV